ncbi:MAG: hypothetical protein LBO09_07920 [Candidatus Peribacteria bacterium]|jgi:hypothetical protein|nr:hypothetical protein [Candidatus Peribacteria bacterium]
MGEIKNITDATLGTTPATQNPAGHTLVEALSASQTKPIGSIEDEQGRKFDIAIELLDLTKGIEGYPDLMLLVNNKMPKYYIRSAGKLVLDGT